MTLSQPLRTNPLGRLHAALEAEPGSAYLLAPDLSIRYVNEGWRRFARENGAPDLATSWSWSAPVSCYVAPALRERFEAKYLRVLARKVPWSHVYECSSEGVYRKFNVTVHCAPGWHGLAVVHSLTEEAPLSANRTHLDDRVAVFTDARGLVVVCSSCGRLRRGDGTRWDWAPGWVTPSMVNVSHGICALCELQFYDDLP